MRSWILTSSAVLVLRLSGCLHHSPGVLYESSFEPLSDRQIALRDQRERDVDHLADKIGPREGRPGNRSTKVHLHRRDYIE